MDESKVLDLKIKANEAWGLSINEGKILLYLQVPQIMPVNGDLNLVLWDELRRMTSKII